MKTGDKVRIKLLADYRYGDSTVRTQFAVKETVFTVHSRYDDLGKIRIEHKAPSGATRILMLESELIPLTGKVTVNPNKYQFTAHNPHAIDWELIFAELSPSSPLALISFGSASQYAAVHKSIITKAYICRTKSAGFDTVDPFNHAQFVLDGNKDRKAIVEWIKEVKAAKWPTTPEGGSKRATVTVTIKPI